MRYTGTLIDYQILNAIPENMHTSYILQNAWVVFKKIYVYTYAYMMQQQLMNKER